MDIKKLRHQTDAEDKKRKLPGDSDRGSRSSEFNTEMPNFDFRFKHLAPSPSGQRGIV